MSYLTHKFDEHVVSLIRGGGVGLLPSDTIYGLSCAASSEAAVERLYSLKLREADKPFIVLISKLEMLNELSISNAQTSVVMRYWPGPLTIVLEASSAPVWLRRGGSTLAVRMPGDAALRELIDKVGPLISTSANRAGQDTAISCRQAEETFGDKLDFYVDAGEISSRPSTIVRMNGDKLEIIRPGALKIKGEAK
jgi:L-threonylcarbamoyladenylate synthase